MRKLICLMLGIIMILGCFGSSLAEGEDTPLFVQIKENVTAKVYAKPGDDAPADALAGGRLCGLLDETNEAGTVWYSIFYLNNARKGATGAVKAEDAEKLDQDQLTALLEDTGKINEVLDLIDALNDYVRIPDADETETAGTGTNTDNTADQPAKTGVKQFYANAMEKLQNVFGSLKSIDLSKTKDVAKDMGEKAKEAGKDLIDKVKDIDLKDKLDDVRDKIQDVDLKEKLDDVKDKLKDIDVKDKLENLKDKLDDVKDKMKDILEDSGMKDKLDGLKDKIKDIDLKDKISDLKDKLEGTRLDRMIDGIGDVIRELKDKDSSLRDALSDVKDELKELFAGD